MIVARRCVDVGSIPRSARNARRTFTVPGQRGQIIDASALPTERNVGASYLLANAVYEHGLQEGARSGELRLAALYPVTRAAHVGIDSRFQIDLERDANEPADEPEWEWRSGLVASYAWNRIVFTGGGGISALRLRSGAPTAVGPALTAGFGTGF